MQVIDAGNFKLRVFERGVGETRACGTGACAALVAGQSFLACSASRQAQIYAVANLNSNGKAGQTPL